jgi:hypothetical protein
MANTKSPKAVPRDCSKEFYAAIKKGDILYESGGQYTVQIEVITDPVFTETPPEDQVVACDLWRVKFDAQSGSGIINYVISPVGLMHNCGRLYTYPAYVGPILLIDGTTKQDIFFPQTETTTK